MSGTYVLDGHTPVREEDTLKWTEWFRRASENDERRVAKTEIDEEVWVSTVFLGIDHGWAGRLELFESMAFGPGETDLFGNETRRYATWEQADTGHDEVVASVRSRLAAWRAKQGLEEEQT